MSGRKTKATRKEAKVTRKSAKRRTEPQAFFEDALLAFLREVGKTVGGIKGRGGAQSLGPDALFVCATEALDLAHTTKGVSGVQGYLLAAAYALAAAMQQARVWNLAPKPASEQPPESPETPSKPPEGKDK